MESGKPRDLEAKYEEEKKNLKERRAKKSRLLDLNDLLQLRDFESDCPASKNQRATKQKDKKSVKPRIFWQKGFAQTVQID